MKTSIGIGVVLTVVVLAVSGLGASAATRTDNCASQARIAGKRVCLRAGARCKKRYQHIYGKHGFTCVNGRLRRKSKSKPTPTPTPTPIVVTNLKLPTATPLPATASTITIQTATPSSIGELTSVNGAVWTAGGPFRIDTTTGAVTGPFTTGESGDVGVGEGSVWASDYDGDLVRRFDASTGKVLATIKIPAGSSPEGIVDSGGAIWVADHHGGTLSRIDPATNTVTASVTVAGAGPSGPQEDAFGFGSVWVDVPKSGAVVRVDPQSNKVQNEIVFPSAMEPCGGVAATTTSIWVTECLDGTHLARIDPSTNKIVQIFDVRGKMVQPVADGDTVWFVEGGDPNAPASEASLVHLDGTGNVLARYALPSGWISGGAAIASGSIWISDFVQPRVIHFPLG